EIERSTSLRRNLRRCQDNDMPGVSAGRACAVRTRFGSQTSCANAPDNRLVAEFRSARLPARHAPSLEKERRHRSVAGGEEDAWPRQATCSATARLHPPPSPIST